MKNGVVDGSVLKTLSAFERCDRDLGRAEQHWVDGVEVTFDGREQFGERLAIVFRVGARQIVGQLLGCLCFACPMAQGQAIGALLRSTLGAAGFWHLDSLRLDIYLGRDSDSASTLGGSVSP